MSIKWAGIAFAFAIRSADSFLGTWVEKNNPCITGTLKTRLDSSTRKSVTGRDSGSELYLGGSCGRSSHVNSVPVTGGHEGGSNLAAPPVLYPNLRELGDYMGLSLSSEEVQKDLALVPASGNAGALVPSSQGVLVAPLTGNNLGLRRAEIRPGLRELHLCKDERGKTGLKLKSIDQGVFVQLVKANSPASLVGLRFGDQVLQINGKDCAGWSTDKANRALKKASPEKIVVIVRDRPFQRTVTMHKDSTGHVGFVIKKGKIVSLTKGGSAARNGLLINHYICELNGQNVIGLKDKQILDILATAGNAVTITIIPTVIYEHMVKRLSPGQIKSSMDHSLPDV
ncbi:syntenin-2 isoform X2 [Lepidochelys kempii]|uniref:syntenin-2 isoform X2 n=1 Tax=Lepidochelys kempii TaxID=8472 RepID=UPI003C6ECA06